jgi:hypothetical protein
MIHHADRQLTTEITRRSANLNISTTKKKEGREKREEIERKEEEYIIKAHDR